MVRQRPVALEAQEPPGLAGAMVVVTVEAAILARPTTADATALTEAFDPVLVGKIERAAVRRPSRSWALAPAGTPLLDPRVALPAATARPDARHYFQSFAFWASTCQSSLGL